MARFQHQRSRAMSLQADAADQQPWRCVTCGEAVNKTTKRDCACTRALLNPEAPCACCGKPTVRGVNSDFCSVDCEDRWEAEQREGVVDENPGSPFGSDS